MCVPLIVRCLSTGVSRIMSADYLVIGHFKFVDDVQSAIRRLREAGFGEIELYSPAPNHDLEDELYLGKPRSPVRRFTLLGGLTGCLGGFLMTIWMSLDWPLRTSAKTVVSIPAFVVIAFECTILLGAIVTLIGMLLNSRIPTVASFPGFRPSFTNGTFGLVARVNKQQVDVASDKLKGCGASDVEIQYVR